MSIYYLLTIKCKYIDLVKDEIVQLVNTGILRKKEILSAPNRSQTYDLPISTSDALPLSYRRLVVARPLNIDSYLLIFSKNNFY